jgi:2'-5' RNA ligase
LKNINKDVKAMRLFVGINLPNEIKQTLLEFQSELRQLGVRGGWKSQENFHITLEFLGELDLKHIPTLRGILTKVAKNNKPFKLNIGGLGAFPSINRAHTLWTSIGESLDELNRLRDEIHTELAKNGFVLEDRRFNPHITLASRPKLDDADLSVVHTKELGEFLVDKVVLFESKALHGKRIYTDLYTHSLT